MRGAALGTSALVAALLSAGCTAVIGERPSPDDPIRCEIVDGYDLCPAGHRCAVTPSDGLSRCVPNCIAGAEEVCNDRDDDCDGIVDNPDSPTLCPSGSVCLDHVCQPACELDADGDGFSTCRAPVDCDDTRPEINPNATEVCDGIDNDCDPSTNDAGGSVCGAGELCAPGRGEATPRCLVPDCTNVVNCGPGDTCNPITGNCVPLVTDCREPTTPCTAPDRCDTGSGVCVPPQDLGTPCTSDVQCGSERCISTGALMLPPDLSGAPGVCSAGCCSDTDCPTDFRCWAPGNGVRGCVPSSMVPIDGAVRACSGAMCASGEVCDARSVPRTGSSNPDVSMFICTPPSSGTTETRQPCDLHSDCASGFCIHPIVLGVPLDSGWCAVPCATSADCGYEINWWVETFAGTRVCGFQGLTSGERLQMCRDVGDSAGGGGPGASCGRDADCRDGYCRAGACSAVCCSDANCGGGICAPVNHNGWEMRCLPRL